MSEQPAAALRRLASGHWVAQAVHVAATLGIADLLRDQPRTSDELAEATGAHADSLYRLLRALAALGVLREEHGRRFALTPVGELLRSDAEGSLHGWAAFVGRPYIWQAWSALRDSVRTGENAFRHVYGTSVWEYRAGNPEEAAIFDGAMAALTRGDIGAVLDAYDFSRFGTVVDVGGGNGALLGALLAAYPTVCGVLFDQEHVVAAADELLRTAGVADRCEIVAGSFFDDVPPGGDAYVLKSIVHDWEDAEAAAILRVCRRAAGEESVLLVVERELGAPNEDASAKLSDLNMLVAAGGRERTADEYAQLFDVAGFRLVRVVPTAGTFCVFEAVPV